MKETDFEFAKPPLSKKYIHLIFEKYQLDFIAYFGENMFYVSKKNSEPLAPLYPNAVYSEDIELVLDFMACERIRRIKFENEKLFRSSIPELRGYGED